MAAPFEVELALHRHRLVNGHSWRSCAEVSLDLHQLQLSVLSRVPGRLYKNVQKTCRHQPSGRTIAYQERNLNRARRMESRRVRERWGVGNGLDLTILQTSSSGAREGNAERLSIKVQLLVIVPACYQAPPGFTQSHRSFFPFLKRTFGIKRRCLVFLCVVVTPHLGGDVISAGCSRTLPGRYTKADPAREAQKTPIGTSRMAAMLRQGAISSHLVGVAAARKVPLVRAVCSRSPPEKKHIRTPQKQRRAEATFDRPWRQT